jgi:hypothetical protein
MPQSATPQKKRLPKSWPKSRAVKRAVATVRSCSMPSRRRR